MTLYRKHRPKNFDDFIGNKQVVNSLKSILNRPIDLIPHAYLFEGDYGTGKTTLARIVAKEIGRATYPPDETIANNAGLDRIELHELDAGSDRGVEAADVMKKKFKYKPRLNNLVIYIIDEIQTSSSKYQESLLKILEEPPPYLYFILCTTNPLKINKGILDRCNKFHLFNYTTRELVQILENVCVKEEKNINKKTLMEISKKAYGSARNAITMLENIIDLDPNDIEKFKLTEREKENELYLIASYLYGVEKWMYIKNTLKNTKLNPESIRQYIIKYCINILLDNENIDGKSLIILNHMLPVYDKIIDLNTLIFIYAECLKELERHVWG
jgi:DNA polymerase-3 subunit gamma/tau